MNKRRPGGMGASSILMIFVVLALTTFGILSFLSARADLRLTERAADHTVAYYKADRGSEAELGGMLAEEIDPRLQETEGMAVAHKRGKGLEDIGPVPQALVHAEILPDHLRPFRGEGVQQGGGHPHDVEGIGQDLGTDRSSGH